MKHAKSYLMPGACAAAMLVCGCSQGNAPGTTLSGLDPAAFDSVIGGKTTALYTLKNAAGMEVCVTNFGGRIVSVMAPDRDGNMLDVVLGFDNLRNYADYENTPSDFGAAIGRYANRINKGIFVIGGDTVRLPVNNYGHCLHGGPKGWQYSVYDADQPDDTTLALTLTSPDGEMNFPGTVTASVTYRLLSDNSIDIQYEATTDKPTVINMTNHSYFNLHGDTSLPVTDCLLYVNADSTTPIDSTFMTTGETAPVEGTPFDFREPAELGGRIGDTANAQIANGRGIDHNWCLNTYAEPMVLHSDSADFLKSKGGATTGIEGRGDDKTLAASLSCPATGIRLEVYTDEPGIQVYTGNFLDGSVTGKYGKAYQRNAAVCLETQHYPDTPNKPQWPSVLLRPGETYRSHCRYKFSVYNGDGDEAAASADSAAAAAAAAE